jgi:hypothetical protein
MLHNLQSLCLQTMLLFCNIELAFYLAQWEEYHTGTLNWSNGWFGVTESQLTQMLLFVLTGIFGVEVRLHIHAF